MKYNREEFVHNIDKDNVSPLDAAVHIVLPLVEYMP